jgi:glycosyl transferase family 2
MQSFSDMEILVVGDGAPASSRQLVQSFANSDSRIRFFEFTKGERRGEAHRAAVLARYATGRIICYCADDDLWLPFHLDSMVKFLKTVDFGHSWPVEVDEFGRIHGNGGDIGNSIYREIVCTTQHINIGLTPIGHTADAYRRLPGGWRPAPLGIGSEVYLCRRFFAVEGLRFGTLHEPSTIRFGPLSGMQKFRDQETPPAGTPVGGGDIADWINCIDKPDFRVAFDKAFLASVAQRVGFGIHADRLRLKEAENSKLETERLHTEIQNRDAEIEDLHEEIRDRDTQIEHLCSAVEGLMGELRNRDVKIERLNQDVREILTSTSWRFTEPARLLTAWLATWHRSKR